MCHILGSLFVGSVFNPGNARVPFKPNKNVQIFEAVLCCCASKTTITAEKQFFSNKL
jgi:hypothetical protein